MLHEPDVCQQSRPPAVAIFKGVNPNGAVMEFGSGRNDKIPFLVVPLVGFHRNDSKFRGNDVRAHTNVLVGGTDFASPTPDRAQHLSV